VNQVEVDLMNALVAIRQARARYEAAVRNLKLQQELLDGEQKKYLLGASTPQSVIQLQRDLTTALSAEVSALAAYSNARLTLDQAMGRTLEASGVSIGEAKTGVVSRVSSLPAGDKPGTVHSNPISK
jgi:outer membrane protein TolC